VEGHFTPEMTEGLPAPAQRFLRRAIAPGTPLVRAATLRMRGAMRLSPGAAPLRMQAEQVLAPPRGFLWRARVGPRLARISGYDRYTPGAGGEMSWRLYGLLPVVRARGEDVTRSAAGRLAGEAVLVPAALLPRFGVVWEEGDARRAHYRMRVGDEDVHCTLEVDGEGRLVRASLRRWRGAGRKGEPPAGYARFDVDGWAEERRFGGYTLPTRFRAGWQLGEPGEFPFFFATLTEVHFAEGGPGEPGGGPR
jgi:hypothetical protein